MKFGVFYEVQLPAPHRDGEETRMFREALEHVELADRLGIHYMWAVEHHFLEDHALSSAPEVWLGAAAARDQEHPYRAWDRLHATGLLPIRRAWRSGSPRSTRFPAVGWSSARGRARRVWSWRGSAST